jgi:hypothetical protein
MPLAMQVLGMLLAGALAVVLARQAGLDGRRSVGAIAAVPVVVSCVVAVPGLHAAFEDLDTQRRNGSVLTADQARVRGGVSMSLDVAFLDWAGVQIGPGETFHLVIGDGVPTESIRHWALYQLAPNLAVERPESADWVVVYGAAPGTGYPAELFERPRRFDGALSIARRRGEG